MRDLPSRISGDRDRGASSWVLEKGPPLSHGVGAITARAEPCPRRVRVVDETPSLKLRSLRRGVSESSRQHPRKARAAGLRLLWLASIPEPNQRRLVLLMHCVCDVRACALRAGRVLMQCMCARGHVFVCVCRVLMQFESSMQRKAVEDLTRPPPPAPHDARPGLRPDYVEVRARRLAWVPSWGWGATSRCALAA